MTASIAPIQTTPIPAPMGAADKLRSIAKKVLQALMSVLRRIGEFAVLIAMIGTISCVAADVFFPRSLFTPLYAALISAGLIHVVDWGFYFDYVR